MLLSRFPIQNQKLDLVYPCVKPKYFDISAQMNVCGGGGDLRTTRINSYKKKLPIVLDSYVVTVKNSRGYHFWVPCTRFTTGTEISLLALGDLASRSDVCHFSSRCTK